MIVLAYIQYLFIFSIRTRNSKAILENLELRYIEPNTGYEISIRKKDIKNSHFKRYIFNKLILELSGNQRLTLINLSNLKILQEQINAL